VEDKLTASQNQKTIINLFFSVKHNSVLLLYLLASTGNLF